MWHKRYNRAWQDPLLAYQSQNNLSPFQGYLVLADQTYICVCMTELLLIQFLNEYREFCSYCDEDNTDDTYSKCKDIGFLRCKFLRTFYFNSSYFSKAGNLAESCRMPLRCSKKGPSSPIPSGQLS